MRNQSKLSISWVRRTSSRWWSQHRNGFSPDWHVMPFQKLPNPKWARGTFCFCNVPTRGVSIFTIWHSAAWAWTRLVQHIPYDNRNRAASGCFPRAQHTYGAHLGKCIRSECCFPLRRAIFLDFGESSTWPRGPVLLIAVEGGWSRSRRWGKKPENLECPPTLALSPRTTTTMTTVITWNWCGSFCEQRMDKQIRYPYKWTRFEAFFN